MAVTSQTRDALEAKARGLCDCNRRRTSAGFSLRPDTDSGTCAGIVPLTAVLDAGYDRNSN